MGINGRGAFGLVAFSISLSLGDEAANEVFDTKNVVPLKRPYIACATVGV